MFRREIERKEETGKRLNKKFFCITEVLEKEGQMTI